MAKTLQTIKGRIRSIQATRKITGAMELVAVSKLRRQRHLLEQNQEYANNLSLVVTDILMHSSEVKNKYLTITEDTNPLTFVFCSDLGLCGGYNINMANYLEKELEKNGEIILIGSKLHAQLLRESYPIQKEPIHIDEVDYDMLADMMDRQLVRYINHEITSIRIIYTKFFNTMVYEPTKIRVIPIRNNASDSAVDIIYEPSPEEILDDLIPMYVKSELYNAYLDSTTSEQSSRRMAMESANDNAEKMIEELTLEYNQARQTAITQEITEIISAADALKEE